MSLHFLTTVFFLDDQPGSAWLRSVLETDDVSRLETAFRAAAHHVGDRRWSPSADAMRALEDNRLGWVAKDAASAQVASMSCLIRAAKLSADPDALVRCWFETGTAADRRAILRALSLLPKPRSHVALAESAARSVNEAEFEAICFDNPYPAAYFRDEAFEDMVERVLVGDLEVGRIVGLVERGRWARIHIDAARTTSCGDEAALAEPAGTG